MVLNLEVSSDADMPRTFAIFSDAFGHDEPLVNAVWPKCDTPAGRASGAERMLDIKNLDPNSTFLKVFDTETGTMIAMAKLNIFKNTIPSELDLDGDFWEIEEDKEYAQHLVRELLISRREMIRKTGGNVLCLDILALDPAHQRRGAGRVLVKWGTKLADELGFPAVVEASDAGRGLYESEGFRFIEPTETRLPAKWEGKQGKKNFNWMVRPAKKDV